MKVRASRDPTQKIERGPVWQILGKESGEGRRGELAVWWELSSPITSAKDRKVRGRVSRRPLGCVKVSGSIACVLDNEGVSATK